MRRRRRHHVIGISGQDPCPHLTVRGIAWDDGGAAFAYGLGRLFLIQPQLGLAVRLVRTMARETLLRQQWANLQTEVDRSLADRDFFPRRRADDYLRDDVAVMTSGEAILDRVESAPEGEASPRLVLTSKVPVRDRRGRIIGVAGISRTVEQLRAGRQQLGRLNLVATRLREDPGAVHRTTDLAKLAGLSASQFERTFRRAFGTTPHRHLLRLRIETACRRLRESDDSIAAIAVGCGFADHAHFTRTFRRAMGMAPTEYRRK